MTTRVVNIRVESCDVYIGRAGRGEDGYFGNPIRVNALCPECGATHATKGATLRCFKKYFDRRMFGDAEFGLRVEALRGKVLGCFCKPGPCHGDVIVAYLEGSQQ